MIEYATKTNLLKLTNGSQKTFIRIGRRTFFNRESPCSKKLKLLTLTACSDVPTFQCAGPAVISRLKRYFLHCLNWHLLLSLAKLSLCPQLLSICFLVHNALISMSTLWYSYFLLHKFSASGVRQCLYCTSSLQYLTLFI